MCRPFIITIFFVCFLCSGVVSAQDADGDGLDDLIETNTGVFVSPFDTGSDPSVFDTDGDGTSDGIEVVLGSSPVDSNDTITQEKLLPVTPSGNEQYGFSVAIDNDTAVVGAYLEDFIGVDSGAVYIYRLIGGSWVQQAHIVGSDTFAGNQFGTSVAVSGDTVLVGSPIAGVLDEGAAYVFTRSGSVWSEQAKLTASDGTAIDRFGVSVGISGDLAVVGANQDDDGGFASGSAYIFSRNLGTWAQQDKLTALDAASGDQFGRAVAISADSVVIGAYLNDDRGNNSGSAYIYNLFAGSWSQQAKLVPIDGLADDAFGWSVAIDADTAVIGSRESDSAPSGSGAAYVYTRSGGLWSQQDKLFPRDAVVDGQFGTSVSLSNDRIVVGASQADSFLVNDSTGSIYLFNFDGASWLDSEKISASDGLTGDQFGAAVAASGDRFVIGAVNQDAMASNSGGAYVIDVTDLDADGDSLIDAVETDTGIFISVIDTGTDPINSDTDSDTLFDGFEVEFGFDPLLADDASLDTDADGLTSLEEQAAGTNPHSLDTDGDGFNDALELAHSSVPSNISDTPLAKKIKLSGGFLTDIGASTAIAGDTLAVGSVATNSVLIYTRTLTSWDLQASIGGSDSVADDEFGHSVALSGDTLIVGAPKHDTMGADSGAAYVFVRSAGVWSEQAKLSAVGTSSVGDQFGFDVAIDGDTALVGAPYENFSDGSAYVFIRSGNNWSQQTKFLASGLGGYSVDIDNETIVFGVPSAGTGGQISSGRAFVYVRSGVDWTHQATLGPSDPVFLGKFGFDVALSDDSIVVGAPDAPSFAFFQHGAAYVFERIGLNWTQDFKVLAGQGVDSVKLGESVAIDGDQMVVGAPLWNTATNDEGIAFVFSRASGVWQQVLALTSTTASVNDNLGRSVALDGHFAIASLPGDDADPLQGSSEGAAIVYDLALDIDFDGLTDLVESNSGTFVAASDTGTDPSNPDSDGDGLSDGFEVLTIGTDPNIADTDGDGFSDNEEFEAGSDPLDSGSFPAPAEVNLPVPLWALVSLAFLLWRTQQRKLSFLHC